MFERFTEKAIKVIMLAQEEARRLGHNFVGTEQILLGLIGEGTGIAAKTLKGKGATLKQARIEVEKIIGRGSGFVSVEIPFTPRAKRVLEHSWDEARQMGHNYIGTEHLLLGVIREGEGVGARVLENMDIPLTSIRPEVIKRIAESVQTEKKPISVGKPEAENDQVNKEMFDLLMNFTSEETVKTARQLAKIRSDKFSAIKDQEFDQAAALREAEIELAETLQELIVTHKQSRSRDLVIPSLDRFTDSALKVILLARQECRRIGFNRLGTEQILIALIEENSGITGKVLQAAGCDLEKTQLAADQIIGKDSYASATYISLTPRLKRVFIRAQEEAKQFGLLYIKKEHLLLALLNDSECLATLVMNTLNINVKEIRENLLKLISERSNSD